MRALAQLLYFLGTIPGLSFFTRIGSNLSRMGSFTDRAVAAKRSVSGTQNKKKEDEEKSDEKKS
ncbi:MAG: hypothetical protein ACJAT5_000634 [Lentimonas sp.]|jgi:hypothetical protein